MVFITQGLISSSYTSKTNTFKVLGTLSINPMSNKVHICLSNATTYDNLSNPFIVTRPNPSTAHAGTYITMTYNVTEHRPIYLLGVF